MKSFSVKHKLQLFVRALYVLARFKISKLIPESFSSLVYLDSAVLHAYDHCSVFCPGYTDDGDVDLTSWSAVDTCAL